MSAQFLGLGFPAPPEPPPAPSSPPRATSSPPGRSSSSSRPGSSSNSSSSTSGPEGTLSATRHKLLQGTSDSRGEAASSRAAGQGSGSKPWKAAGVSDGEGEETARGEGGLQGSWQAKEEQILLPTCRYVFGCVVCFCTRVCIRLRTATCLMQACASMMQAYPTGSSSCARVLTLCVCVCF